MNENQRRILMGAAALIAVMLLFPPYEYHGFARGYEFIAGRHSGSINLGQLFAQWTGVGLVAGIAWWLARER